MKCLYRSKQILWTSVLKSSSPKQNFSSSSVSLANKSYKLVVVGGGAGGCSTAAKFASKYPGQVAVIEPKDTHYYQPGWTLVGGGMKTFEDTGKPMKSVLPKKADWLQTSVEKFDPDNCKVTTKEGDEISYEYLVIAIGLQLKYEMVKGLPEAFETPGVCSNYHHDYCKKTYPIIQDFKEGNALFTFPNTPIKCAGAPQKIMYITDYHFRQMGKREKANIQYHTSLGVLFGVKKYADALWDVVKESDINVNLRSNLIEVKPDSKEAVFQNLDKPEELTTVNYSMLHVTPPMGPFDAIKNCKELVDAAGFVNVNKETLQHVNYKNVFGIGDCTNIPVAKTAAAVASEVGYLGKNLKAVMAGKDPNNLYDGYTSCPLILSPKHCILAEFDMQAPPQPFETMPVNQAKPRRITAMMKRYFFPELYWKMMLHGNWEGPRYIRNALHLGFK